VPAPRTAAAALLAVAALGLPFAFWYRTGWREAEREAVRLEQGPRRMLQESGTRLARALANRLEQLRANESLRPFYHYQSLYHDPKGVSQGASVLPSPLAEGPPDPLVLAHFQIDSSGNLSLPTLGEERLALDDSGSAVAQRAIREELRPVAGDLSRTARRGTGPAAVVAMEVPLAVPPAAAKIERLKPEAYSQNVLATEIYSQIQQGKAPPRLPSPLPASRAAAGREVLVRVGSFYWHTILLSEVPALVALREVESPRGRQVQGFLVSPLAVAESLRGSAFPTRFLSGRPARPNEVAVALEGAPWRLALDPGAAIAAAGSRAAKVQRDFTRLFFAAAAAAGIAALSLLLLLWQAERLALQRSRLAAAAAHELRTPLAGLRLYSEMLAQGLGDPERASEYAHRIAGEAERLGRVVTNLLSFTRLERGEVRVHPEPGDFGKVVREVVRQASLEYAGLPISCAIPDRLPPLRFDPDAVTQLVRNLLDNAEKHTRSKEARRVGVEVTSDADAVTLAVSDNGPGLPPEVRRRLFRPFVRGSNPDAPAGLGLGLALVHAFARAHGGSVSAEDAPGGGTIIRTTFPLL
jgi:signal transduction histidine kinase